MAQYLQYDPVDDNRHGTRLPVADPADIKQKSCSGLGNFPYRTGLDPHNLFCSTSRDAKHSCAITKFDCACTTDVARYRMLHLSETAAAARYISHPTALGSATGHGWANSAATRPWIPQ